MLELDLTHDEIPFGTNIKIFGVGGSGGNAVNTMIENSLKGVEFIVANTDISELQKSSAKVKLQLGKITTKGLGAGANPEIGTKAAEESIDEIRNHLEGADLIFIAAGMGGGTGTGAAPIIANLAREMDILTIGIVNKPFNIEGKKRMLNAEMGIKKLSELVDSLMVVPNEKLKEIYGDMTVIEAFKKADNILFDAVKALSDMINYSGYIAVDFADLKTIMEKRGFSYMGTGIGEGESRAKDAVESAMNNPLLVDVSFENSKGTLINITAGNDVKMNEFEEITNTIVAKAGDDGQTAIGIIFDEEMKDQIKVTLIATGLGIAGTSKFERDVFVATSESNDEDIEKTLEVIKDAQSMDLNKKETDEKKKGTMQMEIPAFLRKFSN